MSDPTSYEDEIRNIRDAIYQRLRMALTSRQAESVLKEWHQATHGVRFSSGWVGDIGTRAYAMTRARDGLDARNIAGAAGGFESGQLTPWRRNLLVHHDYTDPDHPPVAGELLVEFDVNGQYLSACNTKLGDGLPLHIRREGMPLSGVLPHPGYLRLAAPVDVPHPAWRRLDTDQVITTIEGRWLTRVHQVELVVSEALIWTSGRRHLESWREIWRGARTDLGLRAGVGGPAVDIALALVKVVANTTLGGWLKSPKNHSDMYRPDWADMIIAEAEIRKYISLAKCAHTPVGVRRDAAWFCQPAATVIREGPPGTGSITIPPGLEVSSQLGKWKLAYHDGIPRIARVDDAMIAAHREGSEPLVRELLAALRRAGDAVGVDA